MSKKSLFNSVFVIISLSFASSAFATPSYFQAFKAQYPSATGLTSCKLCHDGMPPALNPYGIDFQKAGHNFVAIEGLDSDGDSYTNIQEINAGTWPGDKDSHPSASPADTE